MHLRYYVSDPGYGHASRAIALIRELRRLSPDLSISVRTLIPASYIRNSLGALDVQVTESANDLDLRFDAGLYCDLDHAYRENIEKFSSRLETILREEREFCIRRKVDLVVSDIACYPFHLASELEIPSIAVASFVWSWFLRKLLNDKDSHVREVTGTMDEFYGSAVEGFALPFSSDLSSLKTLRKTSLLVKETTRGPNEVRGALGFKDTDFLIFFTGGFTLPWPTLVQKLSKIVSKTGELKLILSSNASIPDVQNVRKIPGSDMEIQDYVAASDLVVSKPGHSIISESVAYRVPLILTLPTKHPEWQSNLNQLVSTGLATSLPFKEFETFSWLNSVKELREMIQGQRQNQLLYAKSGSFEIASSLIEDYNLS